MKIPTTREEANELLRERCEVQRSIDRMGLRMNARMDKAKEDYVAESGAAVGRAEALDAALKTWFAAELPQLGKRRSLTLLFGRVGVRASNAVEFLRGWREERVLAALKALLAAEHIGQEKFIRMKEALNRDAVRDCWADWKGPLGRCGIKYEKGETFFVEPDVAALDSEAAK